MVSNRSAKSWSNERFCFFSGSRIQSLAAWLTLPRPKGLKGTQGDVADDPASGRIAHGFHCQVGLSVRGTVRIPVAISVAKCQRVLGKRLPVLQLRWLVCCDMTMTLPASDKPAPSQVASCHWKPSNNADTMSAITGTITPI